MEHSLGMSNFIVRCCFNTTPHLPEHFHLVMLHLSPPRSTAVGAADTLVRNTRTTAACRAAPAAEEDWSTPRRIVGGGASL